MGMENNELTDREFWVSYWQKADIHPVSPRPFFKKWLRLFPKAPARFIEIGGFPGSYSAFFKKYFQYEVTLLDYVVNADVIHRVEKINGLPEGAIRVQQAEFLTEEAREKYDVVFSAGFIEHFKDTELLFKKHCDLLATGGTLFISLPNFNGISGWFQKWFDPENYAAHYLGSMDRELLRILSLRSGLTISYLGYDGIPHLWMDHEERLSKRMLVFARTLSFFLQQTRGWIRGKRISPYLVLVAKKT